MTVNPYEPPKGDEGGSGERSEFGRRIMPYVVIGLSTVAATLLAFITTGQWGLNDWPWEASPANLRFYIVQGVPWGILGAVVSSFAYASAATHKRRITVGVVISVVAVMAINFYFYLGIFYMG